MNQKEIRGLKTFGTKIWQLNNFEMKKFGFKPFLGLKIFGHQNFWSKNF